MKKFIGLALATLMALFAIAITTVPVQASGNADFAGGTGTTADPFQISTADQFRAINTQVGSAYSYLENSFVLTSDIDLGGASTLFDGIGTEGKPFKGTFDGADHQISGLAMSSTVSRMEAGLFQRINSPAVLKNLTLTAPIVSSLTRAGALVVTADAGTKIENVHIVGGSVTSAKGWHVGGLVASADSMEIHNASSSAVVSITADVGDHTGLGGLIGLAKNGAKISESSSSGTVSYSHGLTVTEYSAVGGLVGISWGADFSYSYALGTVESNSQFTTSGVGGFAGTISSGVFTKNLSAGRVSDLSGVTSPAVPQGQGGFVGILQANPPTMLGNLWNKTTTLQTSDPAEALTKLEGVSSVQLADRQTFVNAGWLADDVPKNSDAWASLLETYPAVTAQIAPAVSDPQPVLVPQAALTAVGKRTTLRRTSRLKVEGGSGQGLISYKSLTQDICTVDDSGVIFGGKAGRCVVEVIKQAESLYLSASATTEMQILTPYQKLVVSPEAITVDEIKSIRGRYLGYLRADLFGQLATSRLAALSPQQINVITPRQLRVLSSQQMQALKR